MTLLIERLRPKFYKNNLSYGDLLYESAKDDFIFQLKIKKLCEEIKKQIYKSFSDDEKKWYYDYLRSQQKNDIPVFIFVIDIIGQAKGKTFHIDKKIYDELFDFNVFICDRMPDGTNSIAAYDTESNMLFLNICKKAGILTCEEFERIDDLYETIGHELIHLFDRNRIKTITPFNYAANSIDTPYKYFNSDVEFNSHSMELISFLETRITNKYTKKELEYLTNVRNVFEFLDNLLIKKNIKIEKDYINRNLDYLSRFYQCLTQKNKSRLISRIAEYYQLLVKTKKESTSDFYFIHFQHAFNLYNTIMNS